MELDAAGPGEPSEPAHRDLFARHAGALPRPLADLGVAPSWRRDEGQVAVAIEVAGASRLEYFPPGGEDMGLVGQASVPARGGMRIELSYKPSIHPVRLGGVLAVTAGASVRYYAVDLVEPPR